MASLTPNYNGWSGMTPATQQDINAVSPGIVPDPPPPGADPDFDEYVRAANASAARSSLLAEQLATAQQGSINAERGRLGQQEQDAAAYAQMPIQKDLSPVAALLDSWNGTNLAKQYQPQETVRSRQDQMQALQAGLNKARGNLSENELGLIKTRLNNAQMQETNARKILEAKMGKRESADRNLEKSRQKKVEFEQRLRSQVSKENPELEGWVTYRDSIKQMREFVENHGVPVAGEDVKIFDTLMSQAKLSAKDKFQLGAITDSDAKLIGGLLGTEGGWSVIKDKVAKGGVAGVVRALKNLEHSADSGWERKIPILRKKFPEKESQPILEEYFQQYDRVKGSNSDIEDDRSTIEQQMLGH